MNQLAAADMPDIGQSQARIIGILYLGTIVAGVYAQLLTRSAMAVSGNGPATAANILSHQTLYRSGLAADLAMLCCYVAVTTMFYTVFRQVDRQLSLMAAGFSMIGIAVLAANGILHAAPLVLLSGAAGGAVQLEGFALFALKLHSDGYVISLVFFGIYCLLLGYLIFVSGFLPRTVGLLMMIGGICHLINNFAYILAPEVAHQLPSLMRYPPLIGEAALSLWLIAFGLKKRTTNVTHALR
jgi:hypothetical protein